MLNKLTATISLMVSKAFAAEIKTKINGAR